jgi:hypothetical protein
MKISEFLSEQFKAILLVIVMVGAVVLGAFAISQYKALHEVPMPLKDFKDGVQNHLLWSIKNECYFVRPNNDVTIYLIRVSDCDRK